VCGCRRRISTEKGAEPQTWSKQAGGEEQAGELGALICFFRQFNRGGTNFGCSKILFISQIIKSLIITVALE
jgi:hypothetical protein